MIIFIYNTVVVQPLTVQGSAQSLGDSVNVTFTANILATFECKIDNGNFFACKTLNNTSIADVLLSLYIRP